MSIERSVNGIADYWLDQMDALDGEGLPLDQKIKLAKAASQEIREMMKLNLNFKNLMLKAPDLAGNQKITMSLGNPRQQAPALGN